MRPRELDRFKVIQAVADGVLKPWRAAQRLGPATRQIRRLVARRREDGPRGLVSRQRAKPSNTGWMRAETANRAPPGSLRRFWADARVREAVRMPWHPAREGNGTAAVLFCSVSWPAADSDAGGFDGCDRTDNNDDAGLWVPRAQRPPKVYQPRARRSCVGQLIQIDGSDRTVERELLMAIALQSGNRSQFNFT